MVIVLARAPPHALFGSEPLGGYMFFLTQRVVLRSRVDPGEFPRVLSKNDLGK